MPGRIVIGTAGWNIPRQHAEEFPASGSALERYATTLTAAEINSSFHRPHRPTTYARWAASVPESFRFSVKLPKTVTHERRLVGTEGLLDAFLAEAGALGPKFGPLLVQLPPSLQFAAAIAEPFFAGLRERFAKEIVCEPRHPSWFTAEADAMLSAARVARVAADPAPVPAASEPGGWRQFSYFRQHGSPVIYRSAYTPDHLAALARSLSDHAARGVPAWCVFDNTASGAALGNGLDLLARLRACGPDPT